KAERLINDYPEFLARAVYAPTTTSSYSLSSLSLSQSHNRSHSYSSTSNYLLDTYGLLDISQKLLSEIVLPQLIEKILTYSLETTGAQKAYLMLVKNKRISAEAKIRTSNLNTEEKNIEFLSSIPLKQLESEISHTIVNYVMRTQEPLILDNAQQEERFKKDTYLTTNKVLSVFCLPILHKKKITSLLYFENNLTSNIFSRDRLNIMKVLAAQIALALDNAHLYNTLILQVKQQRALNESLTRQNKDLQQFTYITSHNLREPVSNLLGLLELYNDKDLDDPVNQIVIDGFKEVSTNMDTMLRDLSRVIAAKNKAKPPKETIVFLEILHLIRQNLKTQIQAKNTQINQHLEVANIFSIRSYIQSILYNLISNALKYRSSKRDLTIDIHTRLLNQDTVHISIIDNGMGIDLELNKDNLFGLYTRFHPQIEGKGLGLHLVKSHIESMGGRIEVESEVDKGTTFHIYLPK
ncbi:MAG: sensor histidine kinase, partial [Chitinophagales bacterium]